MERDILTWVIWGEQNEKNYGLECFLLKATELQRENDTLRTNIHQLNATFEYQRASLVAFKKTFVTCKQNLRAKGRV